MSETKHEFGNGIVVTIAENKGVYEINFDPGDVDFNEYKVPSKYAGCGIGYNRQEGAEYENIPCIIFDPHNKNWWVNFYGFGSTSCSHGERWTFPKYTNKEEADKFVKAIGIVVNKLTEVGYIKDEVLGEHKFGDVITTVGKKNDEYTLQIVGLKSKCQYPSSYINGSPCVYAGSGDYHIKDKCGMYLSSDGGTHDFEWIIFSNAEKSKATIKLMLQTIEESIKRLNEIEEKDTMDQRRNAEFKFGKITIKFTPVCGSDDEVTMNITGMKDEGDLPEEYTEEGRACWYDSDDGSFVVRNEDEKYIDEDGSIGSYFNWLWTNEDEGSEDEIKIDVAEMIVKEIEKCVERLRAMTGKKEEKTMTEECVFNGFTEYQNCVVYDFSGCKITVKKTAYVDKFEININPGPFNFDASKIPLYGEYRKLSFRVELDGCNKDNNHFWVNTYVDGSYFFKNGDKITKTGINTILKHVKGGVDYFTTKKIEAPVKVVNLMTSAKMEEMLASGSLPSEVSLEKWKLIREYVIVNKCSNFDGIKEGGWTTCALCEKYNHGGCSICPLNKIGQKCSNYSSIYSSILDYKLSSGTHEELVFRIDKMIKVLEMCVQLEKDECKVMTRDEMLDLLDDEDYTPAEISLQKWERKLKYIKLHKNIVRNRETPDYGAGNSCALCAKYDAGCCTECPIVKMNKSERCYSDDSTYQKMNKYSDGNHDEFVKLVEAEVELLKKVVEFEKTPVVKYDIELPTNRKVFDFSGVKVAIKPVGEKFKISIDSNGYDLGLGLYGRDIIMPNGEISEMRFWIDRMEKHDWYMGDGRDRKFIPEEDRCKFIDGEFDNGIELSKEGTLVFATVLNRYLKVMKTEGKLKKCEN